jgi:hypothetical protein
MHTIYDEIGEAIATVPAWAVRDAIASAHRSGYGEVNVDEISIVDYEHMIARVGSSVLAAQCHHAGIIDDGEAQAETAEMFHCH